MDSLKRVRTCRAGAASLLATALLATALPAAAEPAEAAMASTVFPDGWTATVQPDHVRLRKGEVEVRIHPARRITDALRRRREGVSLALFADQMAGRYRIDGAREHGSAPPDRSPIRYVEASVTDLASGRRLALIYRPEVGQGVAHAIEIVAPSWDAMKSVFPTIDATSRLGTYNRFAVDAAALTGAWSGGTSTSVAYEDARTGAYAGTDHTATSDRYLFRPDGSYALEHQGVMGGVGRLQSFSRAEQGRYSVGPWEITLTGSDGQHTVYAAHFEAVPGGRVLHLQNRQYSGMRYRLVRRPE